MWLHFLLFGCWQCEASVPPHPQPPPLMSHIWTSWWNVWVLTSLVQVGNSNRKSLPTCGKPYPNPSPLKLKKKKNKTQPTFLLSSHLRCALERLSPETSFLYIRTVYIFLECVCHHWSQEPTKLCELYVRMLLLFRVRLTIASTHTQKYPM